MEDRLVHFLFLLHKWFDKKYWIYAFIPMLIGTCLMLSIVGIISDLKSDNPETVEATKRTINQLASWGTAILTLGAGMIVGQFIIIYKINQIQNNV